MKNLIFNALLLSLFILDGSLARGESRFYHIDEANSSLVWKGSKVGGGHTGAIGIKSGKLEVDEGRLVGGEFVIDMTTIDVTDLEGGKKKRLDGHLRSDDFFSVQDHPTATLVVTNSRKLPDSEALLVFGELTIKGITQPVEFEVTMDLQAKGPTASARVIVDRSKYDIRFKSGSFFQNLGDNLIYDDFELSVDLALNEA